MIIVVTRQARKGITLLVTLFTCLHLYADNRIVLYLRQAPEEAIQGALDDAKKQNLTEKINHFDAKTPGDISKKQVRYNLRQHLMPNLSGFAAVYGGYMDISDPDGLISFPLRHPSQKVYLAVTPEISLVKVKGSTYSHREYIVNDENPTKLYQLEKTKDAKNIWFWSTKEIPIPQDLRVNPITFILFTKPKNVMLPEGDFYTVENNHLVLPDVFVVSNTDQEKMLMKMLDLKHYFEMISMEEKKASDTTQQKMITNL